MSNLLVTSSVTPSPYLTTFNINTAHPANETAATAINIGNLQEQTDTVSISDQGTAAAGAQVSSTFTAQAGDIASLSQSFNNFVDQASTQFQLFDGSGNDIADNQGTAAQQQAYAEWVAGTLSLNADTYTAVAIPASGSTLSLSIGTDQTQGTSLEVNSQLTGGDPTEYYDFSLSSGNNLQLSFDAGANNPSTRVQLYNSNGNLIADSAGNSFEQANYQALTSGTGLTATAGDYSVAVSYAPGADATQNINYNLQLYSGSNYATVYNNNVTAKPYDNSAAGSVTATSTAQAYSRQAYNKINATALTAVNIGWLAENKSSLQVLSQLTSADSADYYSFTLQSGDNLKFGFDSSQTTNAADLRVQILNSTGTQVIADNEGTAAQQAAYQSLTTTNGLAAKPGGYVVKISYANNAPKTSNQYQFDIYSGTSYAAQYKTIASPQTYGNAALAGELSGSTTAAAGIAAYLSGASSSGGSILGLIAASA